MTNPASQPPRTVAWLITGNEGYGVKRAALTLTLELRKQGWQTPIIALTQGPFLHECRQLGFQTRCLNIGLAPSFSGGFANKALGLIRNVIYSRKLATPLAAALKEVNAHALHFLWANLVVTAGAAASRAGIPCFWEIPNIISPGFFTLNRMLYQATCYRHHILPLANSKFTAATLGDHPVKPEVFYLGTDPARFDPLLTNPVARQQLHIPPDAIVLGIIARLNPGKGQDRILHAIASLGQEASNIHLLLIGGPLNTPYADSIRSLARQTNMTGRLHLLDQIPDPERYYPFMDIAINSRVDPEPFGLSVIEAMMMAKPVLVHALGGPAETVLDAVTGWHVKDPSIDSFAAGIRRAIADRTRWLQMSQAARQHALTHFSARNQAQRYIEIVNRRLRTAST